MASATTTTRTTNKLRTRPSFTRTLRKPSNTASNPDLYSEYASQPYTRPKTSAGSRKTSLAALTNSSLSSIPDASDNYALSSVLTDSDSDIMVPVTPGRSSTEMSVGDFVDVPGGMQGVIRFVGSVHGKGGVFAGVELNQEFASRGKNNGDVDGVNYFYTDTPGAGIFVPISKVSRRSMPRTAYPMTPSAGLRAPSSSGYTPPTPGLPKFSASVGPGARAPSPQAKPKPRMSLPRPESPVRRTQMPAAPRPSLSNSPTKNPANRFAQSVRGTAGDPNKKSARLDTMRSVSSQRSNSAMGPVMDFDDDLMPPPQQPKNNGLSESTSDYTFRRPSSRAANNSNASYEEIERLRAQLEDRDRQLKEQSSTLAEMESSLMELQTIIENNPDGPKNNRNSVDDKDANQLRAMLREKNDKIAMLISEFDAHRADFRSTIDTLELASTETERVYEKRIEELTADLRELESRNLDVDSVASQLKQLEELVLELEEGLEDARRGEAEARGEAEFLRGEVERTRTELRRERDGMGGRTSFGDSTGKLSASKELEQKEDEIRGLKAIIHSLSRDSVPGSNHGSPKPNSSLNTSRISNAEDTIARSNLERQVAELQGLLDKKNAHEQDMERELDTLRKSQNGNAAAPTHTTPAPETNGTAKKRSSLRDSRDTVTPVHLQESRSDETSHTRAKKLDTMPENDGHSNAATEVSALWCEICETSGHDILSCTNMFPDSGKDSNGMSISADMMHPGLKQQLSPFKPGSDALPAPLSSVRSRSATESPSPVKVMPNPMESGPVAGKESGVMDPEKWCAICERDGHDSVDCPFEDAF